MATTIVPVPSPVLSSESDDLTALIIELFNEGLPRVEATSQAIGMIEELMTLADSWDLTANACGHPDVLLATPGQPAIAPLRSIVGNGELEHHSTGINAHPTQ